MLYLPGEHFREDGWLGGDEFLSLKVKRKISASPKKCSVNTAAEHKLCRSPLLPSFSLYAPSLLHQR